MRAMLKVTLLKVRHAGEADAKRLLPYIQRCDIYAPESEAGTLKDAIRVEKMWQEDLKLSRTAFHKKLDGMKHGLASDIAFKTKEFDYLFRQAKPLAVLERFSDEESRRLLLLREESNKIWMAALALLLTSLVDDAIDRASESAAKSTIEVRTRDRHMASNIDQLEARVRATVPSLAKKQTIELVVCIGAMHSPEKYSAIPMDVEVMHTDPFAFQLYENAKDYDRRDLFAYLLSEMMERAKMAPDPLLFRTASMSDLNDMLRHYQPEIKEKLFGGKSEA
jgi:hypothetical protein